jgi:hypothetical protein
VRLIAVLFLGPILTRYVVMHTNPASIPETKKREGPES